MFFQEVLTGICREQGNIFYKDYTGTIFPYSLLLPSKSKFVRLMRAQGRVEADALDTGHGMFVIRFRPSVDVCKNVA